MVSELISCGSGTLIVMVAWTRSCVAFIRHRCQIAGTEFCSNTRQCQFGIRTLLMWDCMGIYECCLNLFLLVLVAGVFRHCRRVESFFEDSHGLSTVHCVASHSENTIALWLWQVSLLQFPSNSRPRWTVIVLCLCLCWNHVEGARRRGFFIGVVLSVPVQGIRVFETLLEMIFFFVGMSVSLFF